MNSQFLNKFKGKTNTIPKEGVANLIQATRKRPVKQVQSMPSDGKQPSPEKQAKNKRKKEKNQKINPHQKQNRKLDHVSQSANQVKRAKEKSVLKTRQILSLKQNKKQLEININVKKQQLKLPKISKENTVHLLKSGRLNSLQLPKTHSKQQTIKPNPPEGVAQKPKRTLVSDSKNPKLQKPKANSHGFESMLDEDALVQLEKLNNFEIIVHEMAIRRKYEQQEEELLQKSRHIRKGVTVHN